MVLELEPMDRGKLGQFLPFSQLEYLALHKVNITQVKNTSKLAAYLKANQNLKELKLVECKITSSSIREELSRVFYSQVPHLRRLDFDFGYSTFFVGDQINKICFISPDLEYLRIRALFESPLCIT